MQGGYYGEVRLFAGTFAPAMWAYCMGQYLDINQNQALYSILGTWFGGDGRTTFRIPDLRGRTAIGIGQGPGLTNRIQGQFFGWETHTLTTSQMPAHNHLAALTGSATVSPAAQSGRASLTNDPTDNYPAQPAAGTDIYSDSVNTSMGPSAVDTSGLGIAVGLTGNSLPFNIMQPSLVLSYIICTDGLYPSRN